MKIRTTKRSADQIREIEHRETIIKDLKRIKDPVERMKAYRKIFGTEQEFANSHARFIKRTTTLLKKNIEIVKNA